MPSPLISVRTGWARACVLACVLLLLPACGGSGCCDGEGEVGTPVEQAPGFLLEDVNDTSASHGAFVSPRAHLGRVSAWYFGQST